MREKRIMISQCFADFVKIVDIRQKKAILLNLNGEEYFSHQFDKVLRTLPR